jgi:hypothetical protein
MPLRKVKQSKFIGICLTKNFKTQLIANPKIEALTMNWALSEI